MSAKSIFYDEPRGYYSLAESAWISGLRPQRLAAWVSRRHLTASQSDRKPYVFCYQDIAEAMLMHELLDVHHAKWAKLRETIEGLTEVHGRWPLSRESLEGELATVCAEKGKASTIVVKSGRAVYERCGAAWQQMLEPTTLGLIMDRLQRGGWAVVIDPSLRHIAIDPDQLSGRPTIRGRRIAAVDVACMALTEDGRQRLQQEYRLDRDEIRDAVKWWKAAQTLPAAKAA